MKIIVNIYLLICAFHKKAFQLTQDIDKTPTMCPLAQFTKKKIKIPKPENFEQQFYLLHVFPISCLCSLNSAPAVVWSDLKTERAEKPQEGHALCI